jgi:3-methyl-2-oxobutanoate hydroxymethyltransferase
MRTIEEFKIRKDTNTKISVITSYDFWSAKLIEETEIDAVLVGDSVAMVIHGYENTINADIEMIRLHTKAVRKGTTKLLISDIPFLSDKKGIKSLVKDVEKLMKVGTQAVKIEGAGDNIENISYLTRNGIPVMGHLGLTPQSVHQLSGFKIQGKIDEEASKIIEDAKKLEDSGCFAIVLEKIPQSLAKIVTESLSIPTIGIGAGKYTSGQILVLHDMLGLTKAFNPKFLKKFLDGENLIKTAIAKYDSEIKNIEFPSEKESYS